MEETFEVKLTHNESSYISDNLTLFSPYFDAGMAVQAKRLITKIGMAFLETGDVTHDTCSIMMTLPELWILREVAKSPTTVGQERVGHNLLVKLYSGIIYLTNVSEMTSIVGDFPQSSIDEPTIQDIIKMREEQQGGG